MRYFKRKDIVVQINLDDNEVARIISEGVDAYDLIRNNPSMRRMVDNKLKVLFEDMLNNEKTRQKLSDRLESMIFDYMEERFKRKAKGFLSELLKEGGQIKP